MMRPQGNQKKNHFKGRLLHLLSYECWKKYLRLWRKQLFRSMLDSRVAVSEGNLCTGSLLASSLKMKPVGEWRKHSWAEGGSGLLQSKQRLSQPLGSSGAETGLQSWMEGARPDTLALFSHWMQSDPNKQGWWAKQFFSDKANSLRGLTLEGCR